ncbi:cilia- and flagella-associated protein 107 isoform X2 [Pteronotus mesoamericanus]|uniref:cilia- and flagella-associated protein 107 isoform X2 n=1 Tax=Pteronotus mesoamericanus TaxID=1884717 RepID=UPI0023EBA019|nr:cilia- and flagella-associated protein 107 isoform X2 [Pteronotus parnellii mesoamericanus]
MQLLSAVDPQSLYTPSWKIESKYSTRVLTGNWVEERKKGLPCKHIIPHHQEPSHRHLIGTYDDHYNRHNYNPGLPSRRTWDKHKLLWLPEKADFPLLAPPTNYGLYEQLKQRWFTPEPGLRGSVYTLSYPRPPLCALSRREHAIPVPPPRLHPVPRF